MFLQSLHASLSGSLRCAPSGPSGGFWSFPRIFSARGHLCFHRFEHHSIRGDRADCFSRFQRVPKGLKVPYRDLSKTGCDDRLPLRFFACCGGLARSLDPINAGSAMGPARAGLGPHSASTRRCGDHVRPHSRRVLPLHPSTRSVPTGETWLCPFLYTKESAFFVAFGDGSR